MTLAATGQRTQVVAIEVGPRAGIPTAWTLLLVLAAAFLISSLTVSWVYDLALGAASAGAGAPLSVQISSSRIASYQSDGAEIIRIAPLTSEAAAR